MFVDSKNIKNDYEIVIIGGGISGLSLARKLEEIGEKKVLIVESGNKKFDPKINSRSYGTSNNLGNWPVKNYSSYYSRLRLFGGNAHIWGGWCMELDEYDYENNKVWAYYKQDLKNEYKNAYKLLNIEQPKINIHNFRNPNLSPYYINIAQGNFIKESEQILLTSKNIDILINAELKKINFKENKISSIEIQTNATSLKKIYVKNLVLSAGGLENTKILLQTLPKELSNENLGKFFMEHPQILVGRLETTNKQFINFLKKFSPPTVKHLFNDKLELDSKKYFSGFINQNSSARGYFVLRSTNVYQSKSLYRLRHIILTRSFSSIGVIKLNDIFLLIRDIFHMFYKKIQNFLTRNKSYYIVVHLEQFPNKENCVYLDENDNLVLNWKIQKEDLDNFKRLLTDLNQIINESEESNLVLKQELNQDNSSVLEYLNSNLFGIGHHMGTTRIGENPSTSVCDFEFKIHNTENLYINSSSLFPSGGIANPTLTLIALSSLLAKRLNYE